MVGLVVASLTALIGLVPVVGQSLAPSASAATTNCSAATAGSALGRAGWTATSNTNSAAADAPQNALDGNTDTRFSSDAAQAAGMTLTVDMGSAQTFDELAMDSTYWPGDYARGYEVQVSSYGTSWTTVASCSGTSSPEVVSFAPVTDQYLQVVLTTGASPSWWSVGELNLYDVVGTTTTTAPTSTSTTTTTTTTAPPGANCSAAPSGTELSQSGWSASTNAPSGANDAPANAVDGNLSTRFSTDEPQASGLYLQVDMGSAQSFDEVDLQVPNSAGDYARGFSVGVSSDGTAFTTVASCTGSGTPEVVSFPAQDARYLRVTLTQAYSPSWWSVDELDLYGGGSTTTTTAATTTTAPAEANCSAPVPGTQLDESGFSASTNAPSSAADAPQNAINNAVSGTTPDRFSTDEAQAAGLYFRVDMGSSQNVSAIEMNAPDYAGDYARGYQVQVSSDASSWSTVATCTGSANPEVVSFPAQDVRYIQVVLTTAVSPNWWSIEQFELY